LEPNEQQAVGARLRAARETLGLTQEDVAGALKIQRTSVIAMEAGKRNVSALELRRLARLYRRSVAWLLGEEDESVNTPEGDRALYRATSELSPEDKAQVLRFAQFLAAASSASGAAGTRPQAARRRPSSTSRDK
jgi:transcriptional regulator with XRE-family HTH domain